MYFHKNVYKFRILSLNKNIIQGVSTRHFGYIKNGNGFNKENLRKFLKTINVPKSCTVFMNQTHSSNIDCVKNLKENVIQNTDGLLTKRKNILICVVTADCLPLVFYDHINQIIGVAHAGYKGILVGIIDEMIKKMQKLGSDAKNIKVGVGPSIGVCCYNVDGSRIEQFTEKFSHYNNIYLPAGPLRPRRREACIEASKTGHQTDSRFFLNLKRIVILNLLALGLLRKNIEVSSLCTKCNMDKFFSYRGEGKDTYGEFVTVIGMV